MSNTVNTAFATFNKNLVNLDSERTKVARASRDWLIGQLNQLPEKDTSFPLLYAERHVKYGSFARNTKIRELDDIDLIMGIKAEGTKYEGIYPMSRYILRPPESASILKSLCNDDGTLNSIKVVNKLVAALSKIDQYKSAAIHRKQEAAILSLTSYEWTFDIVPAFYADLDHYQIPDGNGGWKATDPRVDQERINRINLKNNGYALQLIRTLKFWNKRAVMTTIPSYLFENMILNYCDTNTLSEYIDFNLRDFWAYLTSGIHYSVLDPKGFQGELNTLTIDERNNIAVKASDANKRAVEAINLETVSIDQPRAIKKWAGIFGPDFN